jgi:hypothetical protein
MLSRRGFSIMKKSIIKQFSKTFAGRQGLIDILNSELQHEKKNYSPVDANDMKTFSESTKFTFSEKENSTRLELTKTEGDNVVTVNFGARAPVPQMEDEKGKFFNFIFFRPRPFHP